MNMTHELKTWPRYFDAVVRGQKTFEIRKDDRPFATGDRLLLKEWDPKSGHYTGREIEVLVTYLLPGPAFGLEAGHVLMAVRP